MNRPATRRRCHVNTSYKQMEKLSKCQIAWIPRRRLFARYGCEPIGDYDLEMSSIGANLSSVAIVMQIVYAQDGLIRRTEHHRDKFTVHFSPIEHMRLVPNDSVSQPSRPILTYPYKLTMAGTLEDCQNRE